MEERKKQNQITLDLIIAEYHKAFQEILAGALNKIPFGDSGTKNVFAVKKNGNWGLTTGKQRKNGKREGDTTTPYRVNRMASLGLFRKQDFNNFKGDLHKAVGGNHVDAKYIMVFLYNRVVQSQQHYCLSEESQELGLEEYDPITERTEGNRKQVVVNRYERDKSIRDAFLSTRHGDYSCEVCGFSFESVYGDLGKEFIHVHHKKPLFSIGENYHPVIEKDFALVCPNCHAMLHRNRKGVLTVEELREKILKQKGSGSRN